MKQQPIAFQDLYAEAFSHCYGCGRNNVDGHHLKSFWGETKAQTLAHITPANIYTGGVPDHLYGGLIASLLDCHGTASAAAFVGEALGLPFDGSQPLPRCVTGSLNITFLKPTPVETELTVVGRLLAIEGRKVSVALSLWAGQTECARADMLAIQLLAA
ncbi:MAG: PaaI family thioesterase [Neisseriaceae bacterium]